MSATTPDHICYAVWNNAHGIGDGPVVTQGEWKTYAQDLGGWFMYRGSRVTMTAKSIGGGMYQIKGATK